MRKTLFLLLLNSFLSCSNDNSLENNENIFVGDVNLLTQEEVESFGSNNYTEITGDLNIGDPDFITDINNLGFLSSLEEVGNLSISVDDLVNLNGLNNLTVVNGDFYIRSINTMENFSGLDNLTEINGDFKIVRSLFQNLTGLDNLNTINGNLEISSGYALTSLSGLLLSTIGGDLMIENCDFLTNLSGAETLTAINGNLYIQNNDNLTSLIGLENLLVTDDIIIGGETQFGWDAPNELLSDFCDLTNLFNNGIYGELVITNNLYNPSLDDILNNNCSL
ncbi:hypothetical protein DMZ43_04985 [Meridianimaribacter sp. CL38]|uniref:hypothetical protein n=1 Tax=Meridianimaribacter sp. CL38 TaxID=2213021 RepID=UPI00103C6083|nr:hypothetical protein [Meridianimaribacter sp. CL38]TBV28397.1 hypothetical protein DMZ43_04985 [Meridianimaribacter sp. CL38]